MKMLACLLMLCWATAVCKAQTEFVCMPQPIRWSSTSEKVKDSSLNSTFSYPLDSGELAHVVQGLDSFVIAFDVETERSVNALCDAIDRQQAEIEQLKKDVDDLKKLVRQQKPKQQPARQ